MTNQFAAATCDAFLKKLRVQNRKYLLVLDYCTGRTDFEVVLVGVSPTNTNPAEFEAVVGL